MERLRTREEMKQEKTEGEMFSPDSWPAMKEEIRVSRKVGEKQRRDRLNSLVATLAEEVPFIANSRRRLDKTAILRLTVSYMKLHHGLKRKRLQKALGFDLSDGPYSGIFEQVVNGSLLIASESGEILFVSPNIREIVGHNQTDLIGHNISAFIHPDDLQIFKSQFQERPRQSSSAAFATFQKDENKDESSKMELLESSESENFTMYIRLSRAVKKRADITLTKQYELLNIRGHIDIPAEGRKPLSDESGHMWMVAVLKPAGNQAIREVNVRMSEFLKNNEWATQHGLDGTMWTVDHRGTLFHGYMVNELLGKTPYIVIKEEDLEYVARSHRLIMKDKEIPSTVYRMKNKYSLDLYVQSRSIIITDRWTKEPRCIVSVNTALSKDQGIYLLEEQKRRVQKLIAQTEQLAVTDTDVKEESKMESKELLDSTKTDNADAWKSDENDEYKERSVKHVKNETKKYNDSCCSGFSSVSSSPLGNPSSCSQPHSIDSGILSSGSPDVQSDIDNCLECHDDTVKKLSDTCTESITKTPIYSFSFSDSPFSFSDSSEYSSYGVKRSHEDTETDFDFNGFDEADITQTSNLGVDDQLGLNSSQTNNFSLRNTFIPHYTDKNSVKNNVDSENPLKVGGSFSLLKQMLASKNQVLEKNGQCHINASDSKSSPHSESDLWKRAQRQGETKNYDSFSNSWMSPVSNERDKIDFCDETGVKGFHSGCRSNNWRSTHCQAFESESTDVNSNNKHNGSVCLGMATIVGVSKLDENDGLFSSDGGFKQEQLPTFESAPDAASDLYPW